jgi:predicted RNase H-like HicB family nuclease
MAHSVPTYNEQRRRPGRVAGGRGPGIGKEERPMLTAYIEAAMRHARLEWLDDDREWYGHIPELPGVWATGPTEGDCLAELRSVLEDWLLIGLKMGHDIPPVDGITLKVAMVG